MLGNIGIPTMLLILVFALLLFGPNKLPELGRAFGKTLREFKRGTKDILDDDDDMDLEPRRKEVNRSALTDDQRADRQDNRRLPE